MPIKSNAPVVKGDGLVNLPLMRDELSFAEVAALPVAESWEGSRFVPLVAEETRVRIPTYVTDETGSHVGIAEYRISVSVVREPVTERESLMCERYEAQQKNKTTARKEQEEANKRALVEGVRKETAAMVRDTYSAVNRDMAELENIKARLGRAGIALTTS